MRRAPDGVPERLVDAAIRLLAEQGPSAIKARTVAAATGLSTMVVYSHFGGIPELTRAVIDKGFKELDAAFSALPVTDDPIADLAVQALTCRRVARENPHLYDLMFGLSTRGSYRPLQESEVRSSGRSPAFLAAYAHVTEACTRLVRLRPGQAAGPVRYRCSAVEFRARLHHPRARGDLRRVRRPGAAGAVAARRECFCWTGRYA